MVTLDEALDVVMELSPAERELLLEIVRRRHVEVRRAEIAAAFADAQRAWQAGALKAQTADEVIAALRASLEQDE